jgi:subtilisin
LVAEVVVRAEGGSRLARVGVLGVVALSLLASRPAAGQAAETPPVGPQASYIVVLKDGVSARRVLERTHVTPAIEHRYSTVFNGFAATFDAAAKRQLEADPDVVSVSTNRSFPAADPPVEVVPEPDQQVSTGVMRVGGLDSPTAHIDGVDERVDVDIAIFDGGLPRDHPDLNVVGGVNCTGGKKSQWTDRDGHGTFVAGVAAAKDNELGTVGVAPGARLWAVRVVGVKGYATEAAEICGLEWIARHSATIDVVNISLSGPKAKGKCPKPKGDPLHRALCRVVAKGTVVVASAGNDAADAGRQHYAGFPEVITVSAFADSDGLPGGLGGPPACEAQQVDDTFATWSNFGQVVDITAPGVCVYSAFLGDGYGLDSGSSLSAPLVAGAAALLKAQHPDWSPGQVRQAILAAATPGPVPGDPDGFPEPVLNVAGF